MRLIFTVIASISLAGCMGNTPSVSQEQIQQQRKTAAEAQCRSFGFQPQTEGLASCIQNQVYLAAQLEASQAAERNARMYSAFGHLKDAGTALQGPTTSNSLMRSPVYTDCRSSIYGYNCVSR